MVNRDLYRDSDLNTNWREDRKVHEEVERRDY